MKPTEIFLLVPIGLAIIFGFYGLIGRWRRVLICLVFSYAALIIAWQHNTFLAGVVDARRVVLNASLLQRSALAFGGALIAAFVGVYLAFGIVWRPAPVHSWHQPSGWSKLVMSVLNGAAGWTLGVLLAISITQYYQASPPNWGRDGQFYEDMITETVGFASSVTDPWAPDEAPVFLSGWRAR